MSNLGVRIIAPGVDAEQFATEYSVPESRGLEGIFFLNSSLEKIAHNYAPGKKKGVVVGEPVPTSKATMFKSRTNYIQTDISEAQSMTLFVVARSVLDGTDQNNRAVFIGSYDSTLNPPGLGIYVQNTNRISAFGSFGDTEETNTVVSSSVNSTHVVTDWNLYVAIVQPGRVTMRNLTTGQDGVVAVAQPRRVGMAKLRIGSSFSIYTGECELAVAQIHSAALAEAEILANVADIREYASRRGISV